MSSLHSLYLQAEIMISAVCFKCVATAADPSESRAKQGLKVCRVIDFHLVDEGHKGAHGFYADYTVSGEAAETPGPG